MIAKELARRCEHKFVDLVLDEVEADGSFCGYASLFGKIDLGNDVVERGAFANSLRAKGASGIRMLFQHDPGEPIGTWTQVREDARGLFVRGRLAKDVARAREVLSLMRAGALDGLSIGFRTVKARRDRASGVRRILEADLWEISVVTFPMQPGARIASVKGHGKVRRLPSVEEFETWLTQGAGLSPSEARTVIAKGFTSLLRTRALHHSLAGHIRAATRMINPRGKDI